MSSTTGLSAAQRLQQAHEQQQQQQQQQSQSQGTITQDPFPVLTEDPFPVFNNNSSTSTYSNPVKQQQQSQQSGSVERVDVDDQSAFPSLGGGAAVPKVTGWGSGSSTKIKAPITATTPSSSSNGTITPGGGGGDNSSSATLSFSIPTSSIHITSPSSSSSDSNTKGGRNGLFSNDPRLKSGPPQTLGEVLKYLINLPENLEKGIEIQASSSSKLTTFIIKSSLNNNKNNQKKVSGGGKKTAQEEVERVKTELLGWLEKKVKDQIQVPKNLRALIIGAKGRTLKGITDSTGCSIQIPRDEDLPSTSTEETSTPAFGDSEAGEEDSLGPLISISLSGPSSSVDSAKKQILSIVRERTSKTTISLPEISSEYWIFLRGKKMQELIEKTLSGGAGGGNEGQGEGEEPKDSLNVFVPRRVPVGGKRGVDVEDTNEDGETTNTEGGSGGVGKICIKVSGDKDLVKKLVESIHEEVSELKSTIRPVIFSLPKRQHRFLVGNSIADEILEKTGCAVEVPPQEVDSEDVTVRGPSRETIKAMQLVMDLASATPVEQLDLLTAHRGTHDPRIYARSLSRYLLLKQKLSPIASSTRTKIYLPKPSTINSQSPNAFLEIVGEKNGDEGMKLARQGVISQVRKLPPSVFEIVEIEELVVRYLREKRLNKIKSLEKEFKVEIVLPREGEGSEVLIVYVGEGEGGGEQDSKSALEATKQSLISLSSEFADLVTITLSIPSNLHGAVIGTGGTTLNAVLGEDKLAHVQFGGSGDDVDSVTIRGPKDEAERVKLELERIAEEAKKEEIVNSHLVEFEIETSLVRHVVGKSGSGVNKLREELGVRVDFLELSSTDKKGNKLSKVSIKGRKENVEEAAKRVKGTASRMADEVTLTIPLPSSLDRGSLIGKQGTYLKRLEDKYEVRINFPKSSSSSEESSSSSSSEIVIRGPSKGAQSAKSELVDLISYEKEHGNTVTFSVPAKALSRILGRGGSQINQIKDDTGVASVDVDQEQEGSEEAKITLKGTKNSIKNARTEIEKIAKEVSNEARIELQVPKEYHTTLIGSGGSSIRDLITRCGGPSDGRASGNMVRFPRQGDPSNTVLIVAPSSIAHKIESELSKEISSLASRVVWGVVVPQPNHAAVIGKGAQNLQETQRKHGVKIYMPGWNDYAQAGQVENKSEDQAVEQALEKDLIKIVGPKESVLAAAKELQSIKGRTSGTSTPTPQSTSQHSVKVEVPKRFHAVVAQGGRFFRSLPNGTRVSHEGVKPPSSTLKPKKPPVTSASSNSYNSAARIDEEEIHSPSTSTEGIEFQLVPIHEENGSNDDGEEDTIPWVVESRSEEDAQKVAEEIRKSLERAKEATHIGWVTVPRGMMPRIVGRGGSGLDRLRSVGVDVEVVGKRDANQLTLTGSPSAIEEARSIIEGLNAPRQRRDRDDY